MKELTWVDVDKVGGIANWGDRTNLAVGSKAMRQFRDTDGQVKEREETVVKITRLDNGAHIVVTSASLPPLESQ